MMVGMCVNADQVRYVLHLVAQDYQEKAPPDLS
jgi:hypothetical protein